MANEVDLARIDARLENIEEAITEIKHDQKNTLVTKPTLALIAQRLGNVEKRLDSIESGIGKVVWLVISTVIIAILYLVIR